MQSSTTVARLSSNQRPKTFAEFEKLRLELYSQPIPEPSTDNPFLYALKRKELAIQRLEQLVQLAEEVEGSTIGRRLITWNRQLARMKEEGEKLRTSVQNFATV